MILRYLPCAVMVLAGVVCAAADRSFAPGWTCPESADYTASIDSKSVHSGRSSLLLKSITPDAKSFSAMQRIRADRYRGKHIRLTGWIQPTGAPGGSALWLRVDMANGDYILDAMLDLTPHDAAAAARGWIKRDLVAAVPTDAVGIGFGVRMRGVGEVRADDLSISLVPETVRVTTIERRPFRGPGKEEAVREMNAEYARAPDRPVNPGFESR